MEGPGSLLLSSLGKDYGDDIFKYLAPRDFGHFEQALPKDLVFVEAGAAGGGVALLRAVAGRQHAEAAKKGAMTLVPLGEERNGRITWATELLWAYLAAARLRVRVSMICASGGAGGGDTQYSLVTSGKVGEVWSFGYGANGELGHGVPLEYDGVTAGAETVPRLIVALDHVAVVQVAAGASYSMVLTRDGRIFSWGDYSAGHGTRDQQLVPKQLEGLNNITHIAAGNSHSIALRNDGAVYTWGLNFQGELGLGDHGREEFRLVPNEVQGLSRVVAVAAGSHHSLALRGDGTAMACGWTRRVAVADTFTVVPGLRGVVDIDGGGSHTIAVTTGGDVFVWGFVRGGGGEAGWLQVPTKVTGGGIEMAMVVHVAAGVNHAMALTATGELYTWGTGEYGQLGHGGHDDLFMPRVVDGIGGAVTGIAGGLEHSLVTTAEGRVLGFGRNGIEVDFTEGGVEQTEFAVDGRLGLGLGVDGALVPTAIGGIILDARAGRVAELGRLIEEGEESLRRMEEDLVKHKVEKAALEKKIADEAKEGKEGKE